jgi:hypothetical protein
MMATGTTSKSFRKYLNNTPPKHDIQEIQTAATLGTEHIFLEELM